MMKRILFVILLVPVLAVNAAVWSFEGGTGVVYNIPMPVKIKQNGFPDIHLTARFSTKSFKEPWYYYLRIGRWKNGHAIEFEFIHQKLYLDNRPPEVKVFTITDGYNLWLVNYAWLYHKFIFRAGIGPVITHPESIVRDRKFDEKGGLFDKGYFISGPVGQFAIAKRFMLYKGIFLNFEGKFTAAWTHVKIADGHANVPNLALHGDVGIGYDWNSDTV